MAKANNEVKKVTFGVRRKGKHSKTSGPKDRSAKKSRGQGK